MSDHLGSRLADAMLRARTALVDAIFPPRCITCSEATEAPHGLCPACWADTHFIAGAVCGACGTPLVGDAGSEDLCDGCLRFPPAWDRGRAAILYAGAGRRAVLALKHADRLELGRPLAGWMAVAGRELLADADLMAPVPMHWYRLIRRRYNQAAELSRRLGRAADKPVVADLLRRTRMTTPQQAMDRAARHTNQAGAIAVSPRHRPRIGGRAVLLIDDVMTSGATLSACAEACRSAGARRVDVLVLARVAFEDRDD